MRRGSTAYFRGSKVSFAALAALLMISSATAGGAKTAGGKHALLAANPEPSEGDIKIGFISELSGVASDPGHDMLNGMQLFVDQNPKIAGRKVHLLIENDESNPATAIGKCKQLIDQDKVDAVIGVLLTNIAYAVAPVADKAHVPFIVSAAAADDITQRKRSPWVVRAGCTCSQGTFPLGEYAAKTLHYKKVVTLGMDYPFGYETVGGFQKTYELAGGKVVQKIWAALGFQDFSQQINKIDRTADALFLNTTSKAAEIIPKQLREAGVKLPIIAGGTSFDESILPHLGDESIGALSSYNYSAALDIPANKKFVAAYRSKYHQDPGLYAEGAYSSGLMLKKAIETVNGDTADKQKLMSALRHVEIADAPRGSFKLDDYGNPVQTIYLRQVERKNGKLQNTVVHQFPNVSQFWNFNPEEYMKQPAYSASYPPCTNCAAK